MLADVVGEAFAADPDVRVEPLPAPGDGGLAALSAAVSRSTPDVLVVGGPPPCDLLLDHPRLVLLSLTSDGRQGWVCELRPQARQLNEVSLAGLRTAVREAVDCRNGVTREPG
jgi:hypothetical protein